MDYLEEEPEVVETEARSDASDIDLNSLATSGSGFDSGSDDSGSCKEKSANSSTSNGERSSSSRGLYGSDSASVSSHNSPVPSCDSNGLASSRARNSIAQFQPHPHLRGVHLDSKSVYSGGTSSLHVLPVCNSRPQNSCSDNLIYDTSSLQGGPISLYASQQAAATSKGPLLHPTTGVYPLYDQQRQHHPGHHPFHKVAVLRSAPPNAQQERVFNNLNSPATNQSLSTMVSLGASSSSQLPHPQQTLHHHLPHRQYCNHIKNNSLQPVTALMASYVTPPDFSWATIPYATRHNYHLDTRPHQLRPRSRSDSQSTLARSRPSASMGSLMDFSPDALLMTPPPPYMLQENGNMTAVVQHNEVTPLPGQSGLQTFSVPRDSSVMAPFQVNHGGVHMTGPPQYMVSVPSPDPSSDSNTSTLIGTPPVIVTSDGQLNPALAALIQDAKRNLRRMNRQRKKMQRSASWSGEICRDLSGGGWSSGSGGSGSENNGEERGRKLTVQYQRQLGSRN
ncbi:hypothetical protein BC830DRAFT_1132056, partial [Chytriomyces sp. MP71]